ncbi:hypothetical protein C8R44DRAFT_883115 [Mycena epipterygia]|nr:hypothetical protein C8R44DRAFT_883115 [Mycena epipterygia]
MCLTSNLCLNGYMDAKLAMNATFSAHVPILGTFKLTDVEGNLADGIAVTFNISMLNGNAKVYIFDKWVCIT